MSGLRFDLKINFGLLIQFKIDFLVLIAILWTQAFTYMHIAIRDLLDIRHSLQEKQTR